MSITTTKRHSRRLGGLVLPAAAAGMLALAGCSSSGSGGGTQPTGPTSQSGTTSTTGTTGTTLTVRNVSGHTGVLATADGRTLYETDQENGSVLCKSSACTAVWLPLTVTAGQTPTGPSQLTGTLSTMMRPDGRTQVALDGKPLYTFSFDHGAGKAGGDGQQDSFDGTHFTWHVASASGGAPAPSAPTPSASVSSTSGGYTY